MDWKFRIVDIIGRNIEVIGEAATHLPEHVRERHPDLPWREMRDMRNIVIHEYFGVDKRIVWDTLLQNLPPLVPLLKKMIAGSL